MMKFKIALFGLFLIFSTACFAAEKTNIRLGVLAFGTVNWELAALKNEKLLDDAPYTLNITPIANPQAGKIALQSGAVDMIVSDWIWVSRLRSNGSDYTFYPYSNTAGALVVANESPIKNLKDLKGKKLGIAGGELDKNWLLLQALGNEQQLDLNNTVEKTYGAPPLLNQQLLHQRIDAVINYWHFAARLEAQGYRQIINGRGILQQLGIDKEVPSLGYVFKQSWGNSHKQAINRFLADTRTAKDRLCSSDDAWQKIASLTKAKDTATQNTLRRRYCDGRIKQWGTDNQKAATKIYQLLRKLSQNKLTGSSEQLQHGTFWGID